MILMALNVKQKNYLAAMALSPWALRAPKPAATKPAATKPAATKPEKGEAPVVTVSEVSPSALFIRLSGDARWDAIEAPLDKASDREAQKSLLLGIANAISASAKLVLQIDSVARVRVLLLSGDLPTLSMMLADRAEKMRLWKHIKS
jgi:hypothetical protein